MLNTKTLTILVHSFYDLDMSIKKDVRENVCCMFYGFDIQEIIQLHEDVKVDKIQENIKLMNLWKKERKKYCWVNFPT